MYYVHLFDPEIYTTQTLRELSEEIIRESAFLKVHQEIPFGLGVKILKYDESREDLLKIYAEIWVNRDPLPSKARLYTPLSIIVVIMIGLSIGR